MESNRISFKEQLAFGEEGEHEVASYLISRGVTILPLYQFENNTAPLLYHIRGKIISPDLICFGRESFMVEVKTKNQWVKFNGIVETGLNQKHFNHYSDIQVATGNIVYVFFNHKTEKPTGFYFCKLNDYTRVWDGRVNGKLVYDEMVFYNINILKKLDYGLPKDTR
jgi:hypothetical protein